MLCYAMLCYAMLCCAMLCYAICDIEAGGCAGLVRPMERPPGSPGSPHQPREQEASSPEGRKNRWAAAGQAVLNPTLQKEQSFPNSLGRSHFPR